MKPMPRTFVAFAMLLTLHNSEPTFAQIAEDDAAFLSKYGKTDKERPDQKNPFDAFDADQNLGPGPHVLVIAKKDGGMTQIDYRSGKACQLARDSVRKQVEPPPGAIRPIVGGEPALTAVCVPR